MARYRYYLTLRPPEPCTVPEPDNVKDSECYDMRKRVDRVGDTWGWVEYDHPLAPKQISDYELAEETFPYIITFEDGTTGRIYTTAAIAYQMRQNWKGVKLNRA